MKRVPNCNNCKHLKTVNMRGTCDYMCSYFKLKNDSWIGYGLPQTTPKWCPKREKIHLSI